jgi:hypothetical protein
MTHRLKTQYVLIGKQLVKRLSKSSPLRAAETGECFWMGTISHIEQR